jgi:DNA-directed RNA polymerase II subunit RPB3
MNVTSNHLEVQPFPEDQDVQADPGEELSKRGEYFGHPVGKSESTPSSHIWPLHPLHSLPM